MRIDQSTSRQCDALGRLMARALCDTRLKSKVVQSYESYGDAGAANSGRC